MAKESKEAFSGKLKDLTFEVFDEKVLTCAGSNLGTSTLRVYGAMNCKL
jgi:hypothetical protein